MRRAFSCVPGAGLNCLTFDASWSTKHDTPCSWHLRWKRLLNYFGLFKCIGSHGRTVRLDWFDLIHSGKDISCYNQQIIQTGMNIWTAPFKVGRSLRSLIALSRLPVLTWPRAVPAWSVVWSVGQLSPTNRKHWQSHATHTVSPFPSHGDVLYVP